MTESAEMKGEHLFDKTIGNFVAEDFRTAGVFDKHGIDFCSDGVMTLADACRQKGLKPAAVLKELQEVWNGPGDKGPDFLAWDPSRLIDHIVKVHHGYVYGNKRRVSSYARKIAASHGLHHPELVKVSEIFDQIINDLMPHLRKEEELFFPLVKKAEKAIKMGSAPEKNDVETMRKFLPEIVFEHREVETALLSIRELSRGYKIFGVVCSAQGINYEKFKEFEADLKKHVHLENNILLPKIKQMLKAY